MGKQWKQWMTLYFFFLLGPKITVDGECSHGIKRPLLLSRKIITNLYSILKSRDVTLLTKVHLAKAMVFPVVMYGCEGWTVKKAESWRIDAFEPCCWRRLLRVSWTSRRSNQSILKEISPEYSLAVGEGDDREWDGWMASLAWWTWVWTSSGSWWWTGKPGVLQSMGSKESDMTEQLNWTDLI